MKAKKREGESFMVVREVTTTTILDILWNFAFTVAAATILNYKIKQNSCPSNQHQISPHLSLNPPSKVLPYSHGCRCRLLAMEECHGQTKVEKQLEKIKNKKPFAVNLKLFPTPPQLKELKIHKTNEPQFPESTLSPQYSKIQIKN